MVSVPGELTVYERLTRKHITAVWCDEMSTCVGVLVQWWYMEGVINS